MKKLTSDLGMIALVVAGLALVGTVVNFVTAPSNKDTVEVGLINFNTVREKSKVFQQIASDQEKYDLAVKEKMDKDLAPLNGMLWLLN